MDNFVLYDMDLLHDTPLTEEAIGRYTANLFADAYSAEDVSAVVTKGVAIDKEVFAEGTGSYVVDKRVDFSEAFKKFFTIEKDCTYTLSFKIKLEKPEANQFYLYRQSWGSGAYEGVLVLNEATHWRLQQTTEWQTFTQTFTPSFADSFKETQTNGYVWLAPCGLEGAETGKIWIDEVSLRRVPALTVEPVETAATLTEKGKIKLSSTYNSKYVCENGATLSVNGVQVAKDSFTLTATNGLVTDSSAVEVIYDGVLLDGDNRFTLCVKDLWNRDIQTEYTYHHTDHTANMLSHVQDCASSNGFSAYPDLRNLSFEASEGFMDNTSVKSKGVANYSDIFEVMAAGYLENGTTYRLGFAQKNLADTKNKGIQLYYRYYYSLPDNSTRQFAQFNGVALGHAKNTDQWRVLYTDITPDLPEGAYDIQLKLLFTPCGTGDALYNGYIDALSFRRLPATTIKTSLESMEYQSGKVTAVWDTEVVSDVCLSVDGKESAEKPLFKRENGKTTVLFSCVLSDGEHTLSLNGHDYWQNAISGEKSINCVNTIISDYRANFLSHAFDCESLEAVTAPGATIDHEVFYSGSGSVRTDNNGAIGEAWLQDPLNNVNCYYSAQIKLQDPTETTFGLYREYYAADGTYLTRSYKPVTLQPTTDWQYVGVYTMDNMSEYAPAKCKVYLTHLDGKQSVVHIDELAFRPVPPEDTFCATVKRVNAVGQHIEVEYSDLVTPYKLTVGDKVLAVRPTALTDEGKTTLVYADIPFVPGKNEVCIESLDLWGRAVSRQTVYNYIPTGVNLLGTSYECDSTTGFYASGAKLEIDTTDSVSGGSSLKSTIGSSVISINKTQVYQYEAGRKMRYSFYIKTSNPENNRFYLIREYWKKSDGSFYAEKASFFEMEKNTDWQKFTLEFADTVSDADFGMVGLYLRCIDATDITVFHIDCLSLEALPLGDKEPGAPDGAGIGYRAGSNGITPGIRFGASLSNAQKERVEEYGFIVTREALLDGSSDFTMKNASKYIQKPLYRADGNEQKPEELTFNGVVTGIPSGREDEVFWVRPYIRYKNSDTVFYGKVMSASLAEAKAS